MTIKSSQEPPKQQNIIIAGPPGSGKTVAFATASKYFPHDRLKELSQLSETRGASAVNAALAKMDWVVLKDLVSVPIDDGANDGLRAMKIDMPYNAFHASLKAQPVDATSKLPNMLKVVQTLCTELEADLIATPEAEFVGIDTLSNLHVAISAWATFAGAGNKFEVFDKVAQCHQVLFHRLHNLNKKLVILSHLKADTPPANFGDAAQFAAQQLKQEATRMTDAGKLTLNLPDKIKTLWQGNSMSLAMSVKRSDDGKRLQRFILTETESTKGIEARVREDILVDRLEEVNLRGLLQRMGKI